MEIPENVKRLLWEYDLDETSVSKEIPNAICERVMAHGGWDEMKWLVQVAGTERLRSYLEERGADVLPPREVAFWSFVCVVPERQASEWIGAARERQAEWHG
jgi:hypothetical protein